MIRRVRVILLPRISVSLSLSLSLYVSLCMYLICLPRKPLLLLLGSFALYNEVILRSCCRQIAQLSDADQPDICSPIVFIHVPDCRKAGHTKKETVKHVKRRPRHLTSQTQCCFNSRDLRIGSLRSNRIRIESIEMCGTTDSSIQSSNTLNNTGV